LIKIKRIYEKPEKEDGVRILVDRLRPRGLSKEKAKIDFWFKEIAPSDGLRKWFAHDTKKWPEFQIRYKRELGAKKAFLKRIKALEKENKTITLLFSAKDSLHNNAVVLRKYLSNMK
jgi:uncharacterized protein YeaO (DUF488 family)